MGRGTDVGRGSGNTIREAGDGSSSAAVPVSIGDELERGDPSIVLFSTHCSHPIGCVVVFKSSKTDARFPITSKPYSNNPEIKSQPGFEYLGIDCLR